MYKVDLLPYELQRDVGVDVKKLLKRLSVFLAAIFLLVSCGTFVFSELLTRKEIAVTEKELSEIQVTVNNIEEIKKQRQNNQHSIQNYKALINKKLSWSYLLEDLNSNLPVDMWLASLELSFTDMSASVGTVGQIAGQSEAQAPAHVQARAQSKATQANVGAAPGGQSPAAGQKDSPSPDSPPAPNILVVEGYSRTVPSVGIFVNNLDKMPYFTSVKLNEISEEEKNAAIKFKLTAILKDGGR
ncbi:MAG: Fimbrial assembly protein (PilN) [Pelotomaculum sp. PtaU1.Bin035]|nr:MAG: Fimbrial assembly protein (PilN) [Pelotomaculum sp. PtaU1.Bin035]